MPGIIENIMGGIANLWAPHSGGPANVKEYIMSKDDLHLLHQKMINEIEKKGGKINKIYCCLHLEKDNCNCRKPKMLVNFLFLQAQLSRV